MGRIGDMLDVESVDDFVLEDSGDGGKKLVEYNGQANEVIIPDELGITEIGHDAFKKFYITKIESNTVKKIGNNAFANYTNLTNVDFPSAGAIGEYAFWRCFDLTTVDFPNVETIGKYAFRGCFDLTTGNFPKVKTIGENALVDCYKLKIKKD